MNYIEKEIPIGWKVMKLGEYAKAQKGKKPKNLSANKNETYKIPYVNIKAFEKNEVDEYTDGEKCVLCDEGDFLMVWDGSRSGYVGRAIKGAVGSTLVKLSFPEILDEYAFYFLQSKYLEINTRAKGTGTPHVDPNLLWNYKFPIPPSNEQQSIVDKISELFSEIEKGIETLKETKKQLEVYRQAILKSAFEGKFTELWRRKNKNEDIDSELDRIKIEREQRAKEYGKKLKKISIVSDSEIDELPKLPLEWRWIRAGELYYYVTSGSRGWAKYYSEDGAIFVRITNLDYNSLVLNLEKDKIQYVSLIDGVEGKRTKIDEGDFLFSITGYLGMFAIAPNLKEAYVNQHIALCKPITRINRKYFGYWVMSKTGGNYYINKLNKGATKAGLTLDDIQKFYVPMCSLLEQNIIVDEIEKRLSQCENIEKIINESLDKSEALKQSIFKKAFAGKLLEQGSNVVVDKEFIKKQNI